MTAIEYSILWLCLCSRHCVLFVRYRFDPAHQFEPFLVYASPTSEGEVCCNAHMCRVTNSCAQKSRIVQHVHSLVIHDDPFVSDTFKATWDSFSNAIIIYCVSSINVLSWEARPEKPNPEEHDKLFCHGICHRHAYQCRRSSGDELEETNGIVVMIGMPNVMGKPMSSLLIHAQRSLWHPRICSCYL